MQLSELVASIPGAAYNMRDVDIESIEFDSRRIKHGALFIAIKGEKYDGHMFVSDAERKGAVAVITQQTTKTELPQVVVDDTRAVLGHLAVRFYGEFSDLTKVGITGTNGKTTTAFLVHAILARSGQNPGLIGTVYYAGKTRDKAQRTTPEILDILRLFRKFEEENIDSVVMEISSHALKLGRVENIRFDVAVFTNLSQDHLDFHTTMDDYKATKLRIFSLLKPKGCAVYNNDDEVSKDIKRLSLRRKISFGTKKDSDVRGRLIADSLSGMKAEVYHEERRFDVRSALMGAYNFHNILAAFAVGVALKIDPADIIKGIASLRSVRGRMERVHDNVFVDFAHTPAAIENILRSAREYVKGKLIIVFGCGGDRDREKRPIMGAIATRLADLAVITSDNPRSEPPQQIINDIKRGITGSNFKVIADRKEAIAYAIARKGNDDIVIIAGKGHEEYQIVNHHTIEFDDAEVARKCIVNSC
jgi:UDP-N-acetylmuramoyl-L-alanyl-D-glutamate--2,6-diaminopimelate ligase